MPLTIDKNKIEDLKHAPNLPLVVDELLAFLEVEKLKRKHFLENLDDDTKSEFIEGEIILNSPVKRKHYLIVTYLLKLLSTYVDLHDLGTAASEKVLIHLTRNDFEPDIVFFSNDQVEKFDRNTMLHPAPSFVVEVLSSSTEKRDRGIKFEDYANHSVKEYWIINPDNEEVEQFVLGENKDYTLQLKSNSGKIKSVAIKGFEIPIEAIFNKKTNLEVLKKLMV